MDGKPHLLKRGRQLISNKLMEAISNISHRKLDWYSVVKQVNNSCKNDKRKARIENNLHCNYNKIVQQICNPN